MVYLLHRVVVRIQWISVYVNKDLELWLALRYTLAVIIITSFSTREKMQYLLKFTNLGQVTNSFWMILTGIKLMTIPEVFFLINTQLFSENSFKF